nr:inactive dipeptidyl peptidase 10-like [Lepeophtheirus salmonis]
MAGAINEPPDISTVTMIHKVKSKMGYTEMHTAAPGFGENELVASSPSQKNWKGITIAILVILIILASVGLSVVLLTPPDPGPGVKGERFSIEDILSNRFQPRRFNGTWISENELIFRDHTEGLSLLKLHSASNFSITQIVTNTTFRRLDAVNYKLSPNRKYILLSHNIKKRYRYSVFAFYTVYNIETGSMWNVESSNYASSQSLPLLSSSSSLSFAMWLPNSPAGLIFVENYNIYYVPDITQSKKKIYPISPRDTVIPEVVIHGIPDWIYEEDILKQGNAIWVSPNGKKIVYATFNDTNVQEVVFEKFGSGETYPSTQKLRYPKAGTPNPSVSLWVVDLSDLNNLQYEELKPPLKTFHYRDYYFTAVNWIGEDEAIAINWMNRAQNYSISSECRGPTWLCKDIFCEENLGGSWSTLYSPPIYGKLQANRNSFLIQTPLRDGDSGYYTHIALVSLDHSKNTSSTHPITLGKYEVREIQGWNEKENLIYFTGVPLGLPSELHLYQVSSRWKSGPHTPICITCSLHSSIFSRKILRNCSYVNSYFSPSLEYYVLECLGPGIPATYLFSLSGSPLPNQTQTFVFEMDANADLEEASKLMAWPRIQIKSLPVMSSGDENVPLRMKIYYPPDIPINESSVIENTFPVVLHVYSGPGTQLVTNEWMVNYNTFMASRLRYIVIEVDGAGSIGQGESLEMSVKGQLGKKEIQDQVDATRYFINNMKYVDKERVAVSGVSYGGYVSVMLLTMRQADFLICGVSISPVVDWRYYESSYSERYMGFPSTSDNIQGYEDANLIKRIPEITDKNIFLAHGSADRNVHFQNSMLLAKALVYNSVNFEQQIYPDEGHFLEGVKYHLYRSVGSFLEKCFYKPPVIEE